MSVRRRTRRRPVAAIHEVRSIPRQQRAKLTIQAIQQAALELGRRDGFSGLGTNQIADHAGVSIGTLYQYFSSVEALLISMFEGASAEFAEATKALMVSVLDVPIRKAVPAVIDRLLRMHDKQRDILLRLPAEMPELRLADRPMAFDNLIRGGIRSYLQWQFPGMPEREVERRVFFLEQVELGCIRRFLSNPPPQVSRRAFIDDLASIVAGYIEGTGAAARRTRP